MRLGFMFHEFPAKDDDVLDRLFAPGPGRINAGIVLNGDADYYINRFDWEGMEWTIRLFDYEQSNIYGRGADWTASAMSGIIQKWAPRLGRRARYQYANEINLSGENAGALPSFEERLTFHQRVVELLHNWHPDAIIAAPADSPGHKDVDGKTEGGEEIRRYEPLWRQLAANGGEASFHFYADHDAGGFLVETLYSGASTHNRAFIASQWLDDFGLTSDKLGRVIDETNEKDPDRRTMRDFPPYARRLKAAGFRRLLWFPWSSGDAAHDNLAMHRICREPDFVDWCRGLVAELDEATIVDPPPILPPDNPPVTGLPKYFDRQGRETTLDYLQGRYLFRISDGSEWHVSEIHEAPLGEVEWRFTGPGPTDPVTVQTDDGAYRGGYDSKGFWTFEGSAGTYLRDGKGPVEAWIGGPVGDPHALHIFNNGLLGDHEHCNFVVTRAVAPPPPPPPPVDNSHAEQRVYIEWAAARWDKREDARDRAAFVAHLAALGLESAEPYRYGWPVA